MGPQGDYLPAMRGPGHSQTRALVPTADGARLSWTEQLVLGQESQAVLSLSRHSGSDLQSLPWCSASSRRGRSAWWPRAARLPWAGPSAACSALLSSSCIGMHNRCSSCGEGKASRGRSKKLLWMIISAELTHRGIIGQATSGALGKERKSSC